MPKSLIISVEVRRNEHGWYIAESEDLPGLYIAGDDRSAVIGDVDSAIRALFAAKGESVEIRPAEPPRAILPSKLAGAMWWVKTPTEASA